MAGFRKQRKAMGLDSGENRQNDVAKRQQQGDAQQPRGIGRSVDVPMHIHSVANNQL